MKNRHLRYLGIGLTAHLPKTILSNLVMFLLSQNIVEPYIHTVPTAVQIPFLYVLKVIYHPLYGMNNYVLIWGDWLSCDPLRGSHDSQSPHIRKHLCPILWQL